MHPFWRLLLLWLTVALPLQAQAATALPPCAPTGAATVVVSGATPHDAQPCCCADALLADATTPLSQACQACTICGAGLALPIALNLVLEPGSSPRLDSPPPTPTSFVTAGLERPPRLPLV